jgi:hypothetical protein
MGYERRNRPMGPRFVILKAENGELGEDLPDHEATTGHPSSGEQGKDVLRSSNPMICRTIWSLDA